MSINNNKETKRRVAIVAVSLLLVAALLAVLLPMQRANNIALAATCAVNHTVVSGETLSSIALKYNTTVAEIAAANNLKEPYTIFVGQTLCIPGSTATQVATGTASTTSGPNFTVQNTTWPGFVQITVAKYPKNSPYYVRVSSADSPTKFIKIGTIRTDKEGAAKRLFKLPKALRTEELLIFCLKNQRSDAVQCKYYIPPTN